LNHLINEVNTLLKSSDFEYAVCGGYAIELFLDKETRKHGDIDILVYWSDRDKIILYMYSFGWEVYEMCGNGIVHHITDINNQKRVKRNVFCIKDNCELVKLYPHNETDMYYLKFNHSGQTILNFIEFLFNDKTETDFLYARNIEIKRALSKAIMSCNNIPYLAPELILLYKSTDVQRDGYQLDYDEAICMMNSEQKNWLKNALNILYPSGHLWATNI